MVVDTWALLIIMAALAAWFQNASLDWLMMVYGSIYCWLFCHVLSLSQSLAFPTDFRHTSLGFFESFENDRFGRCFVCISLVWMSDEKILKGIPPKWKCYIRGTVNENDTEWYSIKWGLCKIYYIRKSSRLGIEFPMNRDTPPNIPQPRISVGKLPLCVEHFICIPEYHI